MSRLIGSNAVTTRMRSSRHVVTDKKNAAFHRRPEIEVTLFPFNDFYPQIHWIVEDGLLRLVR
jgi:hypothetical protein